MADAGGGQLSPTAEQLHAVLKKYWGHNAFRHQQLEIIQKILYGKDVVALMATGMGKSLCYQLPSVALRETTGFKCATVVISPLISLMEDQVAGLRSNGIAAVALTGEASREEAEKAVRGDYALVYLSPEKLEVNQDLLRRIRDTVGIACFAVDECHCVSQWGHSFRSSYLKLSCLREQFEDVPIIALSATATHHVLEDVVTQLRLEDPLVVRTTVNRPNLHYAVMEKGTEVADLRMALVETCPAGSAIVYVLAKKEAEALAALIQRRLGVGAACYHAGMSELARRKVYDDWSSDKVRVVVATVAFGMGIDKPDVRLIVNYGLTKSVEDYYQMTGRAGRDGLPSRCLLFYSNKDSQTLMFLANNPDNGHPGGSSAAEASKVAAAKIQEMQHFARAAGCRRKALLAHFGEELRREGPPEPGTCCDFCELGVEAPTAGEEGQVVRGSLGAACYAFATRAALKAVDLLGVGMKKTVLLLMGSEAKDLRERRDFERLKASCAWGAAKKPLPGGQVPMKEAWWQAWVKQLVDVGLLAIVNASFSNPSKGTYQRLEVTAKGRAFLAAGERAPLPSMVASQEVVNAEAATKREQQLAQQCAEQAEHARLVREQERQAGRAKEEKLLQALLSVRAAEADRVGAKAYQVADEPQLRALARARPSTLEALGKAGLEGWGEAKVRNHGRAFVDALVAGCRELELAMDVAQLRPFHAGAAPAATVTASSAAFCGEVKWTDALAQAYAAFMEEKRSVHAIATDPARKRGPIKEATVRGYLAKAALTGRAVDWDRMPFPQGLLAAVQRAMEQLLSGGGNGAAAGDAAALDSKAIRQLVPDYWQGQEAEWGDVEAARIYLFLQQSQAGNGSGRTNGGSGEAAATVGDARSPPGLSAPGAGGNGNAPPVGAWLTTRKRPSSSSSPGGPLADAAGASGGAAKVHRPAYCATPSAAANPNNMHPAAAVASSKLYVPTYARDSLPAATTATAPVVMQQEPQPPTPQALLAALGESPQGLTMAEMEARFSGAVGPCLAALQEEGAVYVGGSGRFLLL